MSQLSEDDSSSDSSSNEFLVPPNKIDLSSSFFTETKKAAAAKPKPKRTRIVAKQPSSSDESDLDDLNEDDNVSSAELLAQVLKNLENSKNPGYVANATGLSSGSSTSKAGEHAESKGEVDLSKQISDLLLQGESATTLAKEEDDEDQEERKDEDLKKEHAIPEKGVQIHLPGQNFLLDKKKKKQRDLQQVLKNKINQRLRKTQVFVHKVGLLCGLAHGFFLNGLVNDPDLLGTALSLLSPNNYPKGRADLKYLEKFTKWFGGMFKIFEEHKPVVYNKEVLLQRISERKIYNYVELVLLYAATVRGMGLNCRLVISLQPPPLKPRPDQLFKIPEEKDNVADAKSVKKEKVSGNGKGGKSGKATKSVKEEKEDTEEAIGKSKAGKAAAKAPQAKGKAGRGKSKAREPSVSPTKVEPQNSREAWNSEAKKRAAALLKGKTAGADLSKTKASESVAESESTGRSTRRSTRNVVQEKPKSDGSDDEEDKSNMTIARKLRARGKKDEKEETSKADTSKSKSVAKSKSKTTELSKKRKLSSSVSSFEESSEEEDNFSTDDEYAEMKPKKRVAAKTNTTSKNQTIASKLVSKPSNSRKLLSSDDENESVVKNAHNVWIEVYLESEESWISVSIMDQKIHCVSEIFKKAAQPVLYVVAWNSAGTLKDVTRRYCPHWLTDTRKKRVEEKWWIDTLSDWKEKNTAMSKAEDDQLLQRELEQPLPKTVGECKGHPLYALTRHLLKFEALYPPEAVPLGHLKTGEAIYSRHCVHTLYSRETWVRRARVVKPAQEAYKIVKSMPKYDKLSGMKIKDQPLELFGKWQTTPYVPPVAKDGKVPRNEYGNVDLFKMCMLPTGTAYINLPALNRVARKLNIDCAPACVGFNFGCRGALPAFEGFVVCEEYEDTIREAWEDDQIESRKRAEEKRLKRVYGNWKKLIRGLFIREKLAAKYNFAEDEENADEEDAEEEDKAATTSQKIARKTTVKAAAKKVATAKRAKQEPGNSRKKSKR